jgi:MFS family permease
MTIGTVVLASMTAFEYLAATTAMPTVARELDGLSLYALAFGGSLAAGAVGLVVGGNWSDATGPQRPVWQGVGWFVVGLVVGGLAPSMWVLVAGRMVQGFGGGLLSVALYVVVGHCYAARVHPKMFGFLAAAWVVPSIIGQALTGLVVTQWGWRWIFLALPMLAVPAALLVRPALANMAQSSRAAPVANSNRRIVWVLIAGGIATVALVLNPPFRRRSQWWAGGLPGSGWDSSIRPSRS